LVHPEPFFPDDESKSQKPGPAAPPPPRPDWLIGAAEAIDLEILRPDYDAIVSQRPKLKTIESTNPDGTHAQAPPPPPAQPTPISRTSSMPAPTTPQDHGGSTHEIDHGHMFSTGHIEWRREEATADEPPAPVAEPQTLRVFEAPAKITKEQTSGGWTFAPADAADPVPRAKPLEVVLGMLKELVSDKRFGIALGVVAVVIITLMMRAGAEPSLEFQRVRRHPERYDGQQVKVRGKVGDVFPFGGSYAFDLLNGRDTIVVFSRYRVPVTHQTLTIIGSVSTGYLEGVPRAAIYERK
jgi:hypothetical protein